MQKELIPLSGFAILIVFIMQKDILARSQSGKKV